MFSYKIIIIVTCKAQGENVPFLIPVHATDISGYVPLGSCALCGLELHGNTELYYSRLQQDGSYGQM